MVLSASQILTLFEKSIFSHNLTGKVINVFNQFIWKSRLSIMRFVHIKIIKLILTDI
jgi:hypothetical protein